MTKLKLITVVGTRPEIIRLAEIIKLADKTFDHILVHTGQNYDTIFKDCDRDNWMTAEESKAYGLVDEVLNRKSPK